MRADYYMFYSCLEFFWFDLLTQFQVKKKYDHFFVIRKNYR